MKIALIGATGMAGSRIREEAILRGHDVTGIERHPENLPHEAHLSAKKGDIHKPAEMIELLKGHDVVISAVDFSPELIEEVKLSGVKRYLVVGGAGSLFIAPGVDLIDSGKIPEVKLQASKKGRDFLNKLKQENDLDWTFISPSLIFQPGERTGKFRIGGDDLLVDEEGKSSISAEDFAIAMLDEIENPKYLRKRITVGY